MKRATWSVALSNAKLNAIRPAFNLGFVSLYDGDQPARVDTAITTQTLLAVGTFDREAFREATDGVLIANPIGSERNARADGTPTFYRCFASDGVTALHDGSIGSANANGLLAVSKIVRHAVVEFPEFRIEDMPEVRE